MALYRVSLFEPDGSVRQAFEIECADDDAAIDRAGDLDHPHQILVSQDDREVVRFRAWPGLGSP